MAEKITAEARTNFGKGAARKLRAAGRVPAVVYGHGTDPVHISLPAHETALVLRRANAVLDLTIDGGPLMALVKDVQRDPVRQIIEHIDLLIVRSGEKVEVEVPVVLTGEVAPGNVATLDSQTIALTVLATAIPRDIEVSVEGLTEGAHVTAADIELPEGAELAADPELLVVGVQIEAAEEALENETESETEGDAEPEADSETDADSAS